VTITAIVENPSGWVTAVVVDDITEHPIAPPIPREDLGIVGQHVAELSGYTVDCDTLELTPIDATTPKS
jgi:hypothetical protein